MPLVVCKGIHGTTAAKQAAKLRMGRPIVVRRPIPTSPQQWLSFELFGRVVELRNIVDEIWLQVAHYVLHVI
jgi:hypothetical protein